MHLLFTFKYVIFKHICNIQDWSEEVELSEKLEAERASRSSSVLSLRENVNVSGNETTSNHSRRKKKKREKKHVDRGR